MLFAQCCTSIAEQVEKGQSFDTIDINSIQVSEARPLGTEIVAKRIWNELGFEEILASCNLSQTELSTAMALIIGRLICPGSELETHRWFQTRTALTKMTLYDTTGIGKDIFYPKLYRLRD